MQSKPTSLKTAAVMSKSPEKQKKKSVSVEEIRKLAEAKAKQNMQKILQPKKFEESKEVAGR